jgi:hypothetical protein
VEGMYLREMKRDRRSNIRDQGDWAEIMKEHCTSGDAEYEKPKAEYPTKKYLPALKERTTLWMGSICQKKNCPAWSNCRV